MRAHVEPLMTVVDLEFMPEDGNRYEVIEGELFVSSSPSLTHQRVSGNLYASLRIYLNGTPIGEVLAAAGVVFDDLSGVIPDLVFISQDRRLEIGSTERITGAPDIVIEILSPRAENSRRDRVAKMQLYGRYGVKEYWLVDPLARSIEVYVLSDGALTLSRVFRDSDTLTTSLLPGYELPVSDVFSF